MARTRTKPAPEVPGRRLTPARRRVLATLAEGPARPTGELARAAGVGPSVVKGLAELGLIEAVGLPRPPAFEAHGQAVAAAIRERFRGGVVLVVGHSDTVPAILKSLGGPSLGKLCEPTEYASLFTLVLDDPAPAATVRSWYGEPDPPKPPECR